MIFSKINMYNWTFKKTVRNRFNFVRPQVSSDCDILKVILKDKLPSGTLHDTHESIYVCPIVYLLFQSDVLPQNCNMLFCSQQIPSTGNSKRSLEFLF